MRRAARQAALAACLLACGLGAAPIALQDIPAAYEAPTPSQYVRQEQVDALENLLGSSESPPSAEDLIEYSRLLSEPADQINWLIERVAKLAQDVTTPAVAENLRKLTRKRIARMEDHEYITKDEAQALYARLPGKPSICQVTDPEQLRELARELDSKTRDALTDPCRFRLVARGVPPARLGLDANTQENWDKPRVVLLKFNKLLLGLNERSIDDPPLMCDLLDLEHDLRQARRAFDSRDGPADETFRQLVIHTFDIAEALLGRAMGVDGHDRRDRWLDHDGEGFWQRIADELGEAELWQWAAAARVLQAATTPGTAGDAHILDEARNQLEMAKRVAEVDEEASAFCTAVRGWLSKLEQPDGPELAEGSLPLTHDFSSRRREAREKLEKQFKQKWEKMPARPWKDLIADEKKKERVDKLFTLMQHAKASELGLPVDDNSVVQTSDVISCLSVTPQKETFPEIHLFLEVLEIGEKSYGFALIAHSGTCSTGDSWDIALIESESSRTVIEALSKITSGRLLYAPDGDGRTQEGLKDAETVLLGKIKGGDLRSWLVYLPSGSALMADGHWTYERTLRLWYRTSASMAVELVQPEPVLDFPRDDYTHAPPRTPLAPPRMFAHTSLQAMSVGGKYPDLDSTNVSAADEFLKELMSEKTSGKAKNVIAIMFSKN